MHRRSALFATIPALAALVLQGCGGDDVGFMLKVHPAGGKVSFKGEPVRGAFVRFHPVDPAAVRPPEGKVGPPLSLTTDTDKDGVFVLSSYYADDGVPAGAYVVTVTPPSAATSASIAEDAPTAAEEDPNSVENSDGPALPAPARRSRPKAKSSGPSAIYQDPATSTLKAVVKPGAENRFEFALN